MALLGTIQIVVAIGGQLVGDTDDGMLMIGYFISFCLKKERA